MLDCTSVMMGESTMAKSIIDRARFFLEHAGYCEPPGRVACALVLARAEARAEALGLSVVWDDEQDAWEGDCPAPPVHACAHVPDPDPRRFAYLASLGSIALLSWRDPYKRVVEAELAQEALAVLDRAASAASDREAEALAVRATYAGPSA
jgi:hypothetical protein